MNKRKFKVIVGNKTVGVIKKHQFLEAHVTNTRLMGVLGLRIKWMTEDEQLFAQFFHLDAEEYGLDDYVGVLAPTEEEIGFQTARMMGGLGGELVWITEREARYLLREFIKRNNTFKENLPDPLAEYDFALQEKVTLSSDEISLLWNKICEPLEMPMQLVNYFVMRAVGGDYEALNYLSACENENYRIVETPGTLLKNVTETIEDSEGTAYLTESIIDEKNQYKMILSEIRIGKTKDGLKVTRAEVRSTMNITAMEAAFGLTKPEYISIYYVEDSDACIQQLDTDKPHAMKHAYEGSYLFTEFNPTNDHVKSPIYYLNEDVYGIYYLTDEDQLLVAAYSEEKIKELEGYFTQEPFNKLIQLEERLRLNRPLLYEFVQSDYGDFFEFLADHEY
ncbi:hypothetical protein [Geosporobacter ferrireducens]|uniref:Uncharacterized protein n=2 Tax=Geosporobacter ferrireducens TaxID=1424294 RepID=A0A1D8GGK8_9FIRM|nr:hypothetical protein [Geosporobacter ferrireducens]AOT70052.1 hypothetical protein Gferi_10915 [Geosporobacter ferrireducens]MTI53400.1 hypothetical protein [Geosporobacter ferrireducens]